MKEARHIHLDPIGGIAGDMFIAAMLDAMPELEEEAFAAMFRAGLPGDWRVSRLADRRAGIAGSRLFIEPAGELSGPGHKSYAALRQLIADADIDAPAKTRALSMLKALGEAEAKVHGVDMDRVHFHELAGWDSLADLVAAAWLIERCGSASWSVGPLPLGSGRVQTDHGPLPVPAPATTALLEGFELIDDGVRGERITPTGAAILRSLKRAMQPLPKAMTLAGSGAGLGTSDFPGIANCLRVLVFTAAEKAVEQDVVGVIEFFVDDQTPEDLAIGLQRLGGFDGVLDIHQISSLGRKGRLGSAITVLCRPAALESVSDMCFRETTTIGLRTRLSERRTLAREAVEVDVGAGRKLDAKRVVRPGGGTTTKIEAEALAAADLDAFGRDSIRRSSATDWEQT